VSLEEQNPLENKELTERRLLGAAYEQPFPAMEEQVNKQIENSVLSLHCYRKNSPAERIKPQRVISSQGRPISLCTACGWNRNNEVRPHNRFQIGLFVQTAASADSFWFSNRPTVPTVGSSIQFFVHRWLTQAKKIPKIYRSRTNPWE